MDQIFREKRHKRVHFNVRGHSGVTQRSGGVSFPGKKRYEGVRFNVISVTRGWVGGVKFPGKKHYVTLEWPLTTITRGGRVGVKCPG